MLGNSQICCRKKKDLSHAPFSEVSGVPREIGLRIGVIEARGAAEMWIPFIGVPCSSITTSPVSCQTAPLHHLHPVGGAVTPPGASRGLLHPGTLSVQRDPGGLRWWLGEGGYYLELAVVGIILGRRRWMSKSGWCWNWGSSG